MLLILTHENADFDAVASQLGAHKLYPEGVPLLSWRTNRNVNQFLTLYWDAFGFVRPEDWQRKKVQRVILVDTGSLPSVRGIRHHRVLVQIIDHHELESKPKHNWSYHLAPVGATSTILVEMLQAAGVNLTATEATLMLLGIHEDTGSLVYDTTTARDAQAASWLLGQGARLSVVRRFLNIDLSEEQQDLLQMLQDKIQWTTIQGQNIAVAAVKAPEAFDDEISAVAHRLRDAIMPDGLYLLVQLKPNHIQLVARSSSAHVDVSETARALGGGGHSRAAAATIMDQDLDNVEKKLIELLPKAVRPMTKVSQIMSYGLHTVYSDISVQDAFEQMQRFGHEGYPVLDLESQEIVGLLTRRMVDRAMSHKLRQMPVSQIMKAGAVMVRPSDSVEEVRRLMIEEGWGQIPVVEDREKQPAKVIGIVTRTDLIALYDGAAEDTSSSYLKELLANSLSKVLWRLVQKVGYVASELNMPLYFVGGLVRDLLLKKSHSDIDMVVEGDAISLVARLRSLFGGDSRSHAQFGTAKWMLTPEVWRSISQKPDSEATLDSIDFVTARSEFYTSPTALPEVERGSIKLDLHRRDFTINTLAVRLDGAHLGELLDFYGGRRDLESKLIRVLHSLSFVDDPTRILRAARLEQRLGFSIEPRTEELLRAALPMLKRVSGDRIRNELEMCLLEPDPIPIFKRLEELGVLSQIHPSLSWQLEVARNFNRADELLAQPPWKDSGEISKLFVYFALWMLSHDPAVWYQSLSRLKVRRRTQEDVSSIADLLDSLPDQEEMIKPSSAVRLFKPYPERALFTTLVLTGSESSWGQAIIDYQSRWRNISPLLNGDDLITMGMEPGPEIGFLLERLLEARLDGEIEDEDGERLIVAQFLEAQEKQSSGDEETA